MDFQLEHHQIQLETVKRNIKIKNIKAQFVKKIKFLH